MKFVHIADMHFDSPYLNLSDKDNMGELRRLEQRKIFTKIIQYIKENSIPLFFISGDLYEHNYIKKSTIDFMNNLFKEIPNTHIFISPGNHDPNLKDSYYNTFNWSSNVKVFNANVEKFSLNNINIYGYGFEDFYVSNIPELENLTIDSTNDNEFNILVIHGTLDGSQSAEKVYNPLSTTTLLHKGFDYVALGHIHKRESIQNKIVYPGSTISHGFDELGAHGMIVGEFSKLGNKIEFIQLDERNFEEIEFDISNIRYKEDLVHSLENLSLNKNNYIKIILTGNRNFEINTIELLKLLSVPHILKIKDNSSIKVDLDTFSEENTLRGIFVKKIMEDLNNPVLLENKNIDKNILEKALEIGLNALE